VTGGTPAAGNSRGKASSWLLLRLLWQADTRLALLTAVAVVLCAILPALSMITVAVLVSQAARFARQHAAAASWHAIVAPMAVLAVLLVAQQVAGTGRLALVEALARRLEALLRTRLMRATLAPVGIGHLEDPYIQDQLAIAQGVGAGLAGPKIGALGLAGKAGIVLTAACAAALLGHVLPVLAVGLVLINLAVGWWSRRAYRRLVSVLHLEPRRLRRAAYFRDLALRAGAEKEVRVFGLGGWIGEQHHRHWLTVMRAAWADRVIPRGVAITGAAALGCGYGVAFWVIAHQASAGRLGLGQFALAAQAIISLLPLAEVSEFDNMTQIGQDAVRALVESEHAIARHDTVVDRRAAAGAERGARQGREVPPGPIVFDDVWFSYPGAEPVLRGISIVIASGSSCAIVGRNGVGKSTLLKLLFRSYEPDSGMITCGGIPISEFDVAAWRRSVCAVLQDYLRLPVSLEENVALGAWDRPDRQALRRAADQADLTPLLGRGLTWHSVLSSQFIDGVELSTGQWQKVAIARGLYALGTGAQTIVLDEPTANLDAEAERAVYESVLAAAADSTLVLASHRFATVRKADRIFVLDKGVVTEEGCHGELMRAGRQYAAMYNAQARLLR
jgi:ATP-binding cassette, subfamily B, bacterial